MMNTIKSSSGLKDLCHKTTFELEEALLRETSLLNNPKFINKLPDKGKKLVDKVIAIQRELEERREKRGGEGGGEALRAQRQLIIDRLEWKFKMALAISQQGNPPHSSPSPPHNEEEKTLRLLATSQTSQREPKVVIDHHRSSGEYPTPKCVTKLAQVLDHSTLESGASSSKGKFVPNKVKSPDKPNQKTNGPENPINTGPKVEPTTNGKKLKRYDECLVPLPSVYKTVKTLDLVESYGLTQRDNKAFQEFTHKTQEGLKLRQQLNKKAKDQALGLATSSKVNKVLKSDVIGGPSFRPKREVLENCQDLKNEDIDDEDDMEDLSGESSQEDSDDSEPLSEEEPQEGGGERKINLSSMLNKSFHLN